MKNVSKKILTLIIFAYLLFLISTQSSESSITFSNSLQEIEIKDKMNYTISANYELDNSYNYLYISPNNTEKIKSNKGLVRIYFREISSKDDPNKDFLVDYLHSNFSTIDFNSGLFINREDLTEKSAKIFIISFEKMNLVIQYRYMKNIEFPPYNHYSNFQFNQFILKSGINQNIPFILDHDDNDYLLILSKTSLRNIQVDVIYKGNNIAEKLVEYLYPNGCSVFLDKSIIRDYIISLNIKNNNNKDETILLGYMNHIEEELFPRSITNGFQIYLEGNNNLLTNLLNSGNQNYDQYFTYQTFSKDILINFVDTSTPGKTYIKQTHTISEYNSNFHYRISFSGYMSFNFNIEQKRNSLYFQYLDYNNNEITQKSLQPLITGVPKSILLPDGKSLYHFLPIERFSTKLNYYLRSKTPEKIYVSFKKCNTYPEGCFFFEEKDYAIEAIENIGLWYNVPTNKSELQLIYVFCEKECSYDILMTYDDDPLFLFPENDYSKFIGDSGKDIFMLPVFEYFETSQTEKLYIDLTIISGKAELTLKNRINGEKIDYNVTKAGNKQSYSITFSNKLEYFKKEIYAIVQQSANYKNTFYNIMYGNEASNKKILNNNIVNMELLTVPEKNKEEAYAKTFIFINKENKLFVSVSTLICKNVVEYNGKKYTENVNFIEIDITGKQSLKIYLLRDDKYCQSGFQEEVILFAYNSDNTNVLISENTLINSKISSNVSFTYLFKPKNDAGEDNSFYIEIESLKKNSLLFNYQLKKVSFNGLYNRNLSEISGQKIFLKNYKYISNDQIKKICGSLRDYEVCSLKMNLKPDSSSEFSLKLRKNNFYYAKNLTSQTLISTVNTINVQYFYIDINKDNNIRLLLNSYGQDLNYKYEVINEKKEENNILPLNNNDYSKGSNSHQITILKNEFSKCNSFCRLYIGVKLSMGSSTKEGSTSFLIGYQYDEGNKFSDINLPLNYFSQYILEGTEEVNYIFNPLENGNCFYELYVIKQNENDVSEVRASISGSQILTSSVGKVMKACNAEKMTVNIKSTNNKKLTFKFRVSSIGQQQIIPVISSYEEKCLSDTCNYLFDDLSSEKLTFSSDDNNNRFVYFYIPEDENSSISYKLLKYNEPLSTTGTFDSTSNDLMKRKNWLQIPISFNEHSVIIQLKNAKDLTLCSTNYNKPNTVTLNYGEKRIFSIQRKTLDNIIFYINKEKDQNKVKIKLHAIKGNGIFNFNNVIYPLGFENAYKEDISIIISDVNNIQLIATNEKNEKIDEYDDFVFTIEYTIDRINQFLYEINYDKINSFKFHPNKQINDIAFYLNFEGRESNDLNINIKIYADETIYKINSYFVNNEFIEKKINDSKLQSDNYNSTGLIKTYIQGGKPKNNILTFSKIEISSDILKIQNNNKNTFVYILFKLEETKGDYKVKIDLYPYNINNINSPLARNHLFIQKIPANAQDYKLFLAKSDIYYNETLKIDYLFPLKKKFDYYAIYVENGNENPSENEHLTIKPEKNVFGKDELNINVGSDLNQKKLSFNLVPKNREELIEELFIFSYKNTIVKESGTIYREIINYFEVSGNSKSLNYTLDAPIPLLKGNTILIIRIYKQDDIKDLLQTKIYDIDEENENNQQDIHYYLPLYLLFSDIKPMYTNYEVWNKNNLFTTRWTTINDIKKGGDLYLTAICVVEDNEREIYFAYKGINKNVENAGFLQDLIDYMKNHIFASIIILIVIILIVGMLINICRSERKVGRLSSVKVDSVEGKLMEDKAD